MLRRSTMAPPAKTREGGAVSTARFARCSSHETCRNKSQLVAVSLAGPRFVPWMQNTRHFR